MPVRQIQIIQLGVGGVGQALVEQVLSTRAAQARHGVRLEYRVLADSRGALVAHGGVLATEVVADAARFKAGGAALHAYQGAISASDPTELAEMAGGPDAILVDTTAAEPAQLLPAFDRVLAQGGGVVLANKKPLCAGRDAWQRLVGSGRVGYEATVGAGLPVIRTLRALLDSGDEVRRIAGVFSGTLGFLMSELESGARFSETVRAARARGWTEPDPRDDLGGTDVARKALILARTMGLAREMADVPPVPLFPDAWADLSVDTFMERLPERDEAMAATVAEAHAAGTRLRYAATVAATGALSVGPTRVGPDTPLGTLRGPDNLVAFHTARYGDRPLVIQGAGAGTALTASAVLTDILTLAISGGR